MPQLRRLRELRGDERGFTLPEVMIVTVLMSILFSIASSTWFGVVESSRVDSATNQVAADLRLAHTSASNQLTDWRVVYGLNGTPVSCGTVDADYCLIKLSSVAPATPAPTEVQHTPRYLPNGTTILGANLSGTTIEFNSNGSAEPLGGFTPTAGEPNPTIRIGSADGDPQRKVDFIPATSRIEIDP